jgi:CRISPR-associated protein Cas1
VVDGGSAPPLTEQDVADGLAAIGRTFSRDPLDPAVAVADGYGIRVRVEKGHLEVADGLGPQRRLRTFSRAERTLRRLVILGDGYLTFQAMRWCRATGVSVALIDPWDVEPLMVTAVESARDGRLRRAQAVTGLGEPGKVLAQELIVAKLRGQAAVTRSRLEAPDAADALEGLAGRAAAAPSVEMVRRIEAEGASGYWQAWNGTPVTFAGKDRARAPAHWRMFSSRRSLVHPSGPRYASDPINAMLNLLYRLLEVEARLACLITGLDPALGVIHADERDRDALVLDLIEPVRPLVDAWLLELPRRAQVPEVGFL